MSLSIILHQILGSFPSLTINKSLTSCLIMHYTVTQKHIGDERAITELGYSITQHVRTFTRCMGWVQRLKSGYCFCPHVLMQSDFPVCVYEGPKYLTCMYHVGERTVMFLSVSIKLSLLCTFTNILCVQCNVYSTALILPSLNEEWEGNE